MTEPLRQSFAKPFAEQLAALRLRLVNQVGTVAWDDLDRVEHERAFVVAGALKADLLADLARAVEKAIGEHRSLDKFRAEFKQIVADRGWHGWTGEGTAKGEAWRTRVIYKTNMATSYAAGRMAQLVKLNYKFWVYKHGNALEPRLQHLAWNGLALPPDHPFWATHAPPNGWGCTCRITGADSAAGIRRAGGDPAKTLPDAWNAISPKTGAPAGIDKGWDYKVGGSVPDEINAFVAQKAAKLPEPIATAFKQDISKVTEEFGLKNMEWLLQDLGVNDANRALIETRMVGVAGDQLSLVQKMAVHAYTRNEFYEGLNDALRKNAQGEDVEPKWLDFARLLDGALSRLPRYAGPVTRGIRRPSSVDLARFEALQPGEVISLNGYSSASYVGKAAFQGPVMLRIKSLSARKIDNLAYNAKEKEALLGRGLQYRVVARKLVKQVLFIDLEELSPAELRRLPKEALFAESRV